MKFGRIEELGLANSHEYFGQSYTSHKLFSIEPIKHNKYLDRGYSTILYIDSLEEVPKAFIECLLNEEDRTFFTNPLGINLKGLCRALLLQGGGGSGICQQAVKNIFFTADERNVNNIKNWNRKLAEILLTINFTRNYSREDILRTYLNNIYVATDNMEYGNLYGLKTASFYHFNKPLDKLTLGECALLVKYINKPSINSNKKYLTKLTNDSKRSTHSFEKDYVAGRIDAITYKNQVLKFRREKVLKNLLSVAKISQDQFNKANSEAINIVDNFRVLDGNDRIKSERGFIKKVREEFTQLVEKYGIDPHGGLKIYTTLNINLQRAIQTAYSRENEHWQDSIKVTYKHNGKDTTITDNLQCAVFCVEKKTGAVLGLLDGRTDIGKNWNNYCFTKRQAGSIFKIFDYYTFFDQHPEFTAYTLLPDKKIGNFTYPASHTKNMDVSVREAVSYSSNIVPYNLVYQNHISLEQLLRVTSLFGVKINNPDMMATLIGQDEVNLAQMVNAYNSISNEGYIKENFYISKITNRSGKVLFERAISSDEDPTLNRTACVKLKECFNGVINPGGTASFVSNNPIINNRSIDYGGKTGTTDNASNLWYVGYTPQFTMGIWQGYAATNFKKAGAAGSDCAILWSQIISKYNGR